MADNRIIGLLGSIGWKMRSAEWKIWSDKLHVRVWPLGSQVEGLGPNGRGNCSPSKISLRVIAQGKEGAGESLSRECK